MRLTLLFLLLAGGLSAQPDTLSINLENVHYPHPVHLFPVKIENQDVRMAYLDIPPTVTANGKTVMLFHGKNFGGYYWTNVIQFLAARGYRIIAPDQIGFARSGKPIISYSFPMLAEQNKKLLDALQIHTVILMGHSMGGMLATRFALLYPNRVDQLILENPLGLEDYSRIVPQVSIDQQYQKELKTTRESVKQYYASSYFPEWKPEYDRLVDIASGIVFSADFPRAAMVSALTYQMIQEQPVVNDFQKIRVPVTLIIGMKDRTIPGKEKLDDEAKTQHGNFALLSKQALTKIPNCRLLEVNANHIPHLETPTEFFSALSKALELRN